MRISYLWLQSIIGLDKTPDETSVILTSLGLEVEGMERVEPVKGGLQGVVVGQVLECVQHPNADRLKLTQVAIGEGEPLMHKGFFDMARMAADRGIRVLSLSNGSTFSSSNVAKLCEAGVCYISVSIDSVDPATFASSRLDGDLKQVLTGIRRLADYRDTHGYRYPRIGLKGTLFTHTEDQLPEIVRVAREHGVDLFESFQPLNPMSTYVPIYPKDQLGQLPLVDRVSRAIARDGQAATHLLKPAASFCEEEGIRVDKNGTPNGLRPNCDEEWVYSLLSGDITPCCQIKTPPSPNWNLARRPLAEIMADPDYENTRFNLWNGLFPPYCEGCWKTRQP